jgi:hypothetical protein
MELVEIASRYAVVPTSGFRVGAVVRRMYKIFIPLLTSSRASRRAETCTWASTLSSLASLSIIPVGMVNLMLPYHICSLSS